MSENGSWRTISGRRVFIKDGQSLSDAIRDSEKFSKKNETTGTIEFKTVDSENINDETEKILQEESDKVYELLREEKLIGAVNTYTQEYYVDVNHYLRNGFSENENDEVYKGFVKSTVKDLDKAIGKYNLSENIKVFKGSDKEYYENYNVGDTFNMKEFNSTSLREGISRTFLSDNKNPVMVEINVPKGTNSLYIGKNTGGDYEAELLIARNTNYKVISKKDDKIVLEVVKNVK